VTLQPDTSELQQFRSSREIPVGFARVDVPKIGRQHGQPGFSVSAIAIGVKKRADGEAVPVIPPAELN
jgi:hypothetical protein